MRPSRPSVLLADKEGGQLVAASEEEEEVLDEAVPGYRAPSQKSLMEILQLDPGDASLATYKRVLLEPLPPVAGMGLGPGRGRQRPGVCGVGAPCDLVSP